MSQLDYLMGRKPKRRHSVTLLFNGDVIVTIERRDWPRAKELVEKLGEHSFDEPSDMELEMFDQKTFSEFVQWLTDETDFIVEHTPEYWDGR